MPQLKNLAAAPTMFAALSLTVVPAHAADLPASPSLPAHASVVPVLDVEASQTAEHRRYNRYRYRRGPGLGDVIAGVLIVGAIARVAKAATRDDRRDRERDYRRDAQWDDERGIDRAVQMCVDAVEPERRIETVERADRTVRGWMVEGTIFNGDRFSCSIDESGRIDRIDFSGRGASYQYGEPDYEDAYEGAEYRDDDRGYEADDRDEDDGQWEDDRYASEWSRVEGEGMATPVPSEPSHTGGPAAADDEFAGDLEIGTGYPGAGA